MPSTHADLGTYTASPGIQKFVKTITSNGSGDALAMALVGATQPFDDLGSLLHGEFDALQLSATQMVFQNENGFIVVAGVGLGYSGSLGSAFDPNNITGTVTSAAVYDGGTYNSGTHAIDGGTVSATLSFSSTTITATVGTDVLTLTGSNLPTLFQNFLALGNRTYSGSAITVSSLVLTDNGTQTASVVFGTSSIVVTADGYRVTLQGTFTPTFTDFHSLGSGTGFTITDLATSQTLVSFTADSPLPLAPTGDSDGLVDAIGKMLNFATGTAERSGDDFNGDLASDLVWQNTNGQAQIWLLDGTSTPTSTITLTNAPLGTNWRIRAQGDFNGDGNTDLLWQSTTGQLQIWFMNGTTVTSTAMVATNPGPSWHVRGVGDFNKDGMADIIWSSDAGQTAIWEMSGSTLITGNVVTPQAGNVSMAAPLWRLVGAGDLFRNGANNTLIYQNNATGQIAYSFVQDDFSAFNAVQPPSPGTGWIARALGDFNSDDMTDVLFQNSATGDLMIWYGNYGQLFNNTTTYSPGLKWQVVGVEKLNFNEGSDIVLQDLTTGQVEVMYMKDDGSVASTTTLGAAQGANWRVALLGQAPGLKSIKSDLNGDASAELVWQNSDGTVAAWYVANNSGSYSAGPASALIGNPGSSWSVIGTGDFDGDSKSDILLQGSDGTIAVWLMNGTNIIGGSLVANPGAGWHAITTGDFNGDGRADILFQNTSGQVAIWLMDANTVITINSGNTGSNPGTSWHVVGAGDFNADGRSDVVLQNTDGSVAIWTMAGTNITGGGVVGNPGPGWTVKAVGDFDGDGKADLAFQNTDGSVAIWLMNGTTVTGGAVVGNPGPAWTVKNALDINGDGKADVILETAGGDAAAWTMNGTSITGGGVISPNAGASWHLVTG